VREWSEAGHLPLVTNEQLYIAVGIPMLFNATLIGFVIAYINARFGKSDAKFDSVDARFDSVDARFDAIEKRFDAIDKRFDDMRDLWRAELRRVEEVLDARLKHLEERG
jgi:hypothetical protein